MTRPHYLAGASGQTSTPLGVSIWIILLTSFIVIMAAGCTTPIDTHGVDAQLAGRCKLMAHQEDRGHVSFGLIPMAIAASNANARRQDVYDSCVAAEGSRELPPETLPALPAAAATR